MRSTAFGGRSDRSARPEAYAEWTELLDRLHHAEALRSLGQRDEAMAIAQQVITQASAGGLRGVEAAAVSLRGRLRLARSELDPAELDLGHAASLALEADLEDVAVEALLGRSRLIRKRREGVEQAVVLLQLASGLGAAARRRGPGAAGRQRVGPGAAIAARLSRARAIA